MMLAASNAAICPRLLRDDDAGAVGDLAPALVHLPPICEARYFFPMGISPGSPHWYDFQAA